MPDEQGRLVVGDRVWVDCDEDFQAGCEAVVTSIHLEEDDLEDDFTCMDLWIASDPDLPQSTYRNGEFHALYGDDTWKLENPHIWLLEGTLKEPKLVGSAKFWRKVEENV